jgi:hypothetical protein
LFGSCVEIRENALPENVGIFPRETFEPAEMISDPVKQNVPDLHDQRCANGPAIAKVKGVLPFPLNSNVRLLHPAASLE